jgi:NAD(P)-dependent dehydrogenase (short-subunit alcohol dehydrogenase family)
MKKSKGVFVITGAGRGLGRSLAVEAIADGYPVALLARTRSEIESLREELAKNKEGIQVSAHVVDLTDSAAVQNTFEEVEKTHGSIATLVNNAATWTGGKQVKDLTREDLERSLALNFFSAFNPTREVLAHWEKLPADGRTIINVGATASLRGGKGTSAFCVAKGALRSLSQSLAKEAGPNGIHVAHLVIDGLIDNPRTRKLNPNVPADHFINPVSIAKSILAIVAQEKSCWTFEWEVRPYNEKW